MYFACPFLSKLFWISTLKICLLRSLNNLSPKPFDGGSLVSLGLLFINQKYLAQFASMSYKVMSAASGALPIYILPSCLNSVRQ